MGAADAGRSAAQIPQSFFHKPDQAKTRRTTVTLSKPVKMLVGVGTVWIVLYPFLFLAVWFSMMAGFMSSGSLEGPPLFLMSLFPAIFPLHCVTMIMQLALMAFYLFHVIKNIAASDVLRVVLGIGTFFMPYIAMPVYYYLYIWREQPPEWALTKEAKSGSEIMSSINQQDALAPPKQKSISDKSVAIIGGIVAVVIVIFFFFVFIFVRSVTNFTQRMQESFFADPTPVIYENLPIYDVDEKPFYQPVELSSFAEISVFKNITAWSDYNRVPILIANNTIFVAGYLQDPKDPWGRINIDLISADVNTGKVNWQALAGSAFLVKDSKHIYAETNERFGPAGVVAYDMNTGDVVWETQFDYEYAVGIGHLILTEGDLTAETYNRGKYASYVLDKETGEIKEAQKDTPRYATDEKLTYNDVVLDRQGYGIPDSITACKKSDGSLVWQYSEPVVSNIAIGGPVTYFLTKNVKLVAVDTETGAVLGTLSFAPRFPRDFDFINTSLFVAADGDIVAVYFEDSKQLSIFAFTNLINE
jgi:outer membrane protein assembly factor BamB